MASKSARLVQISGLALVMPGRLSEPVPAGNSANFQPRPDRWNIRQIFLEQSLQVVTDLLKTAEEEKSLLEKEDSKLAGHRSGEGASSVIEHMVASVKRKDPGH